MAFTATGALLLAPGAVQAQRSLSTLEQRAGWSELTQWHAAGAKAFPETGWTREAGEFSRTGPAGDLVSERVFGDFELEFEWQVAPGGNGGVKYRLLPNKSGGWGSLGCEYQVLDDSAHPDAQHERRRAAALYDVAASQASALAASGRYHSARIVARGPELEHWLDGERAFTLNIDEPAFDAALAESKFADVHGYARSASPILLQDHGDPVSYRNLRARDWQNLPGRSIELFNNKNLDGWQALGDASYTVTQEGTILGEVAGGGQSFLMSERAFGDFILELDVKTWAKGNSGVQIRSHLIDPEQVPNTRLRGYQIEIDPSVRSWSGGLYDEARRGWIDDLGDKPAARETFGIDVWNRFRIEAVGPWIRTWVNGVPAADYIDFADLEGHFGLQVHSGADTRVEWRNMFLQELGRHRWQAVDLTDTFEVSPTSLVSRELVGDFSMRCELQASGSIRVGVLSPELFDAREPLESEPAPNEPQGPRLSQASEPGGFKVQLDWLEPGYHELVVARYGDRMVATLGNTRVSAEWPQSAGRLYFETSAGPAAKLSIQNAQWLVPVD